MLVLNDQMQDNEIFLHISSQIKNALNALSQNDIPDAAFELGRLDQFINVLEESLEDEDQEDDERCIDTIDWKDLYEQQREMSKDYKKLYEEALCKHT